MDPLTSLVTALAAGAARKAVRAGKRDKWGSPHETDFKVR
jgi:hypothetical protein